MPSVLFAAVCSEFLMFKKQYCWEDSSQEKVEMVLAVTREPTGRGTTGTDQESSLLLEHRVPAQ